MRVGYRRLHEMRQEAGLTCPCLTIGNHGGVVPCKDNSDLAGGDRVKHRGLTPRLPAVDTPEALLESFECFVDAPFLIPHSNLWSTLRVSTY